MSWKRWIPDTGRNRRRIPPSAATRSLRSCWRSSSLASRPPHSSPPSPPRSRRHRSIDTCATLDASVRTASDQAIAQVQQSGNNAFGPSNCVGNQGTTFTPTWTLPGTFTVTSHTVTYWNGSSFVPAASLTELQGLRAAAVDDHDRVGQLQHHGEHRDLRPVRLPRSPADPLPSKLVFLQPTSVGTGTINAPVNPQPIVAVEDQNGNIVYSDASVGHLERIRRPGDPVQQLLGRREQGHRLLQRLQLQRAGHLFR